MRGREKLLRDFYDSIGRDAMAHYWWRPAWWKFQKEFETWMVRQCRMHQKKLEERLKGLSGFNDWGEFLSSQEKVPIANVVNTKLRGSEHGMCSIRSSGRTE